MSYDSKDISRFLPGLGLSNEQMEVVMCFFQYRIKIFWNNILIAATLIYGLFILDVLIPIMKKNIMNEGMDTIFERSILVIGAALAVMFGVNLFMFHRLDTVLDQLNLSERVTKEIRSLGIRLPFYHLLATGQRSMTFSIVSLGTIALGIWLFIGRFTNTAL